MASLEAPHAEGLEGHIQMDGSRSVDGATFRSEVVLYAEARGVSVTPLGGSAAVHDTVDTSSFGKCDFGKGQGTKSKGQSTTIGGGVCCNCGESRTLSQRLLESIPKALGNGNRSNSTMKRVETRSAGHAGGKATWQETAGSLRSHRSSQPKAKTRTLVMSQGAMGCKSLRREAGGIALCALTESQEDWGAKWLKLTLVTGAARTLFLEGGACDKTLKEKYMLKFTTATGEEVSPCGDLQLQTWDEQGCKMSSSGTLALVHKHLMAAGLDIW